jgi:signal-transduction protein with cAMP-binding, CBS, and nucleotidyltransferase domain
MTTDAVTVTPATLLSDAAKLMRERNVNSLVLREDSQVVGIFTDEDVVRKIVAEGKDPFQIKVEDIAAQDIVTISPDKDIYDAMLMMRDNDIRQLPVIDQGNFVGIITLKDILKIEPELFEIMIERYQIRSSRVKSIRKSAAALTDGVCEECGAYSVKLQDIDDKFMCSKCVHELAEEQGISSI